MKTIDICIMTKDPEYGIALARSLQQYSGAFSVWLKKPWQIDSTAQHGRGYDLLLTDIEDAGSNRAIFLSEHAESAQVDPESEKFTVWKYQCVPKTAKTLRLAHSVYSQTQLISDESSTPAVIAVCASSGGSGCTSVALGICQELRRFQSQKVLYMNLEEFESTSLYFPVNGDGTADLRGFLHRILYRPEAASWRLDGCMIEDAHGVHTFKPSVGRNPLRELTKCDFAKLVDHISRYQHFSHLVIDCGNGFDASIQAAMEMSDRVFHITGNPFDPIRKKSYLKTVNGRTKGAISMALVDVYNFQQNNAPQDEKQCLPLAARTTRIETDPRSFDERGGLRQISLDKGFGLGILELVSHFVTQEP